MGRFSFSLFNDLPGALSSSTSQIPVLTLEQKDRVYSTQLPRPQPWLITPSTFHIAGILDNDYQSRETYKQLVHMQMLSAEGEVNTEPVEKKGFGKTIMAKLAFIPTIKIKMVLDFLFWWDDEAQRLKKLVYEIEEIKQLMESGRDQELDSMLRTTKKRLDTVPSMRDAAGETVAHAASGQRSTHRDDQGEAPPAYAP